MRERATSGTQDKSKLLIFTVAIEANESIYIENYVTCTGKCCFITVAY